MLIKRDDLVHPEIPGNKWRKLRYNLDAARAGGFNTLLTFGGAYSNHLRATAAAGHFFGFSTIGVVRGEEHLPLNSVLSNAVGRGMRLTYLDRASYRRKATAELIKTLSDQHGDFYLLPEGGSNSHAVRGCAELPAEIDSDFHVICCAVGTGGTLAGIAAGLGKGQRALGFSALKGAASLTSEIAALQRQIFDRVSRNWSVQHDYHFGGFARSTQELRTFVDDFKRRHGVTLEWVYVAKMMYGVFDMAIRGDFPAGTVLVAVVTGPPAC